MPTTAKISTPKLPENIFGVEVKNHELLKLAYDSFLANSRLATATTKQRGEVRGGGKKPWRQKGTGRARFGSSRNPIWRGGGVVFGPRGIENYKKRISTASKRVAIRQALSLANKAGKITILDIDFNGKTSDAIAFLNKNKLERNVLLVVSEKTPNIMRSTNNIQNILVVRSLYLAVYYILNADHIVITPKALEEITIWLSKETK